MYYKKALPYSEFRAQYQTKKWGELRKKILARDKNKCVFCGAKNKLRVHHQYYAKNGSIFDVPDTALITLCDVCHKKVHGIKVCFKSEKNKKQSIKTIMKRKPDVYTEKDGCLYINGVSWKDLL